MKVLTEKIKELGYSKVVKGDGDIKLYLKKYDSRLYFGASITKFPKEVSLAIGIFDTDILKMMSEVEAWEDHNLNIVDFTYKKLVSQDLRAGEKKNTEEYWEELKYELNFLEENMDQIAQEYWTCLSEYRVPQTFSSRGLPEDAMIGLYYGLLNKMILTQVGTTELQDIVDEYILTKKPSTPVKFKISLVMKYSDKTGQLG